MKSFLVYILKGKKLDCNKKTLDLSSVVWYNMVKSKGLVGCSLNLVSQAALDTIVK